MILGNLRKGATSFQFLKLKSGDLAYFQYIFPTTATVVSLIIIASGSKWVSIDYSAMVSSLNSFIGILIGFYIASLAAVTSFPSQNLDAEMKGNTPTLSRSVRGQAVVEKLTRRRFLSILFGYCSILSIIIYITGFLWMGIKLNGEIPNWLEEVNEYARWPFMTLYVWLCFSLVTTTLLALHYLIDRVHRA